MSEAAQPPSDAEPSTTPGTPTEVPVRSVPQQIVEIVSDSGEGAQTAGLLFGTVCAKMGNGLCGLFIAGQESGG